jgi:hypothetical protein
MFASGDDGLLCLVFRQQIAGRQRREVGNVVGQMQHKLFTAADHFAGDGKTADVERRAGGWQLPLQQARQQRQLQGQLPPASAPLNIRRFAVTREVIRSSEQFVLHLADDVANFTPLPAGYLLAEDGAEQTIVAAGEHILFPNPAVKVGLRAGVLVAAIDA